MKTISVEQMKEVDRIMIQEYHISLLQMMENTGRILSQLLWDLKKPRSVTILVGPGNNGGGGLVAARYLHNKRVHVEVVLSTDKLKKVPQQHLETCKALGIKITKEIESTPDVMIDALLGYNASGAPKGKIAKLVMQANNLNVPVLSLDVPTGFNLQSGKSFLPSFVDSLVLTLGMPKQHMENIKRVYVADIGIPREVFAKVGINGQYKFEKDYLKLK
jgi:NAD(P)H-hydrate epimerase